MKKRILSTQNDKVVTQFDSSVNILKDLVQMANTSKLQKLGKDLLKEETKKVMPLQTENQVLEVLMKLNYFINLKDPYTKMHLEHVSSYAVLFGKELNLSEEQLQLLRVGGELHDIGKVGIPDPILRKTESLNNQEFEIMKRH